ncbi:hypothetical protein [Butyrivibrio sp. AE2032]|uniref:hypothetical protein n=1 Tax=Butyrivibrio sp. AE2032 TaxID=1458463 RepID=UPI00055093EB|nr:hypothetical protein [Butyrivibrio sp. AE2032]
MKKFERKTSGNVVMIKSNERAFAIALCVLTVVGMVFRVLYGWDHDESYNILLAQKIADGKVLFRDMWDLHQTAAIFPALLCRLFVSITGSTEGIAVFLRAMACLVQIVLSVYFYFGLKRFYGSRCAFGAAFVIANMLPRATQEIEYSTVSVWGCMICSMLLLQISKEGMNYGKLCIASVFYAAAVYSYPTIIITVPFVAFLIIFIVADNRKTGVLAALAFFAVCMVCAAVLVAYLLANMSVSDFIMTIRELGKNGDHSTLFNAFTRIDYISKSAARLLAMGIAAAILGFVLKRLFKIEINIVYSFVLLTTLFVVILNLTGIRPSGPFGLLERYIGAVILLPLLRIKEAERPMVWLFYGFGIAIYIGVLMGSNLGFNENAMYLESSIVCLVIMMIRRIDEYQGKTFGVSVAAAIVFLLGIMFSSAYFVRIDSTKPANVMQCTSTLEEGPLRGIKVFPEQAGQYEQQSKSVKTNTEEGKLYTLLTREPIMYYFVKGEYISAQYAATGQYYNEQWIDFYTLFGRDIPDCFLLSRTDYSDVSKFYETEFGQWVMTNYSENSSKSDDAFAVFERR